MQVMRYKGNQTEFIMNLTLMKYYHRTSQVSQGCVYIYRRSCTGQLFQVMIMMRSSTAADVSVETVHPHLSHFLRFQDYIYSRVL